MRYSDDNDICTCTPALSAVSEEGLRVQGWVSERQKKRQQQAEYPSSEEEPYLPPPRRVPHTSLPSEEGTTRIWLGLSDMRRNLAWTVLYVPYDCLIWAIFGWGSGYPARRREVGLLLGRGVLCLPLPLLLSFRNPTLNPKPLFRNSTQYRGACTYVIIITISHTISHIIHHIIYIIIIMIYHIKSYIFYYVI